MGHEYPRVQPHRMGWIAARKLAAEIAYGSNLLVEVIPRIGVGYQLRCYNPRLPRHIVVELTGRQEWDAWAERHPEWILRQASLDDAAKPSD